ncbi:MAG: hypothetical protein WCO63_12465 [Bacteroidota bacterium]
MRTIPRILYLFLLYSACISGLAAVAQNSISGKTKYAHKTPAGVYAPTTIGNPVSNCDSIKVLLKQNDINIDTACPDIIGNYIFSNLPNGTYTIEALVHKKWGGVGSSDAQAVMRHFVNFNGFSLYPDGYFTNIFLLAGDVNGMGFVPNALDALMITRRFVGIIPDFKPPAVNPGRPDYTSEKHTIIVSDGINIIKDILVLATGDVNGTFTPYSP